MSNVRHASKTSPKARVYLCVGSRFTVRLTVKYFTPLRLRSEYFMRDVPNTSRMHCSSPATRYGRRRGHESRYLAKEAEAENGRT